MKWGECEKGGAITVRGGSVVRGGKEASEARGIRGIHEIIMVCIKCNLAKRMQRCIEA